MKLIKIRTSINTFPIGTAIENQAHEDCVAFEQIEFLYFETYIRRNKPLKKCKRHSN